MKRKVIQIADSTQLVSLPRKWCVQQGIKKGDELNVEIAGPTIVVNTSASPSVEKVEIRLKDYGTLASRCIHSLYKKGVDEILVHFDSPGDISIIQDSLKNETVGFEIVEHTDKHCLIKNVSGQIEGFDSLLRRTFLLTITLAEDGYHAIGSKNFDKLKNVISLEESNNRLTTMCRRSLNKFGSEEFKKIGPIYYIVEALEKIADQYKYLYIYLMKLNLNKNRINPKALSILADTNAMFKLYYEVFYKLDQDKIAEMGSMRKKIIQQWYELMSKVKTPADCQVLHNSIIIMQKIFDLIGPYLVLKL
jgi:phosphate uptake regulator